MPNMNWTNEWGWANSNAQLAQICKILQGRLPFDYKISEIALKINSYSYIVSFYDNHIADGLKSQFMYSIVMKGMMTQRIGVLV